MSRMTMAIAFGAGYVLGARAGKERYSQIQSKAKSLWQSDTVQTQANKAQHVAKDQAAKAQDAAKNRLPHSADTKDRSSNSADSAVTQLPTDRPVTEADAPASEDMVDSSRQAGAADADGPESLNGVSTGADNGDRPTGNL